MLSIFSDAYWPWYVLFGEVSIQVLCPFLNWIACFFGVAFCKFFINFYINLLSDVSVNTFSHSVGCLFILLMVSFAVQNVLIWYSPIFYFFSFVLLHGENIAMSHVQDFTAYVFFYDFYGLGSNIKVFIHSEFILVCGVKRPSSFIFVYVSVQYSQHHLLNKLSLANCMCLLPLSNIDWL